MDYEVHYLNKKEYASILSSNPLLKKIWEYGEDEPRLLKSLKQEDYDLVIDLHNTLRSARIRKTLGVNFRVLRKQHLKKFIITKLGLKNWTYPHMVDQFLSTISDLNPDNLKYAPEIYFSDQDNATFKNLELPDNYMCIVVGAAYKTKRIPIQKILDIIQGTEIKAVLIGGPGDVKLASEISKQATKSFIDLTDKLSLKSSALVVKNANVVLAGDTGMMHIANAFEKPLIAIYGSTHPVFGYGPFAESDKTIVIQDNSVACRPCTKQGRDSCPKGHFNCMENIDSAQIIEKMNTLI